LPEQEHTRTCVPRWATKLNWSAVIMVKFYRRCKIQMA